MGIIDETAFLKKGIHSTGVVRQHSGGAGGELPGEGLPGLRRGAGLHAAGRGTLTCRRAGPTSRLGCRALAWPGTRHTCSGGAGHATF